MTHEKATTQNKETTQRQSTDDRSLYSQGWQAPLKDKDDEFLGGGRNRPASMLVKPKAYYSPDRNVYSDPFKTINAMDEVLDELILRLNMENAEDKKTILARSLAPTILGSVLATGASMGLGFGAGVVAGAIAGTAVLPGVGTLIGILIGLLAGGLGTAAAKAVSLLVPEVQKLLKAPSSMHIKTSSMRDKINNTNATPISLSTLDYVDYSAHQVLQNIASNYLADKLGSNIGVITIPLADTTNILHDIATGLDIHVPKYQKISAFIDEYRCIAIDIFEHLNREGTDYKLRKKHTDLFDYNKALGQKIMDSRKSLMSKFTTVQNLCNQGTKEFDQWVSEGISMRARLNQMPDGEMITPWFSQEPSSDTYDQDNDYLGVRQPKEIKPVEATPRYIPGSIPRQTAANRKTWLDRQ